MPVPPPDLVGLIEELKRSLTWQGELAAFGVPFPPPAALQEPPGESAPPQSEQAATAVETIAVEAVPPAASQPTPTATLESIREELGDCRRCKLCEGRRHIVYGVGNPNAELMFVGEAPGRDEDRQGIPFVGRAGQLLTRMIAAMGLSRDDVYIANIIKCRPPENRDPEPDEIHACEPFLKKQIEVIRPRVLVSLGRVSAQTLLRVRTPISRLRGRWRDYHGVRLMPTFHPAYLLRSPEKKREVWEDLQAVMKELGIEPSRRSS